MLTCSQSRSPVCFHFTSMLSYTVLCRSRLYSVLLNTDSVALSSSNIGNIKKVHSSYIIWTFCAVSSRARHWIESKGATLRSELSIVGEDTKLLTENKLAWSKICPPLDNGSLEKIEEKMREKQPTAQFLPVWPWKCTSPFCFGIAAGRDWLIASLIQFSRAFFKGVQVSLGFCTSSLLLLAPRFKLCKVIQRICCDCYCRKDALQFKPPNSISNIAVTR